MNAAQFAELMAVLTRIADALDEKVARKAYLEAMHKAEDEAFERSRKAILSPPPKTFANAIAGPIIGNRGVRP